MKFTSPFLTLLLSFVFVSAVCIADDSNRSNSKEPLPNTLAKIRKWLATEPDQRTVFLDQGFAKEELSKQEAKKVAQLLWDDYEKIERANRKQEWQDKKLKIDDLEMRFEYRIFGEKPVGGRSLFISMHGGGNTARRVNDGQWRNQIRLYEPNEGVYLAPRAPTDTWNLWHQSHIDQFFKRIIQNAILFEDVNPDRVYFMGYSAGGDGVFQLAPRMADYLAAASMMAGHPNNASPLGLRNIGFAIHMGEKDGAYDRNEKAKEWKAALANLKKEDPGGYEHEVVIHKGMGHWMQRKDAVAVPWMAKFKREPFPDTIVWHQSGVTHEDFYWLAAAKESQVGGSTIRAKRNGNDFELSTSEQIEEIVIQLNDSMVDLDKPISVKMSDKSSSHTAIRTAANIYKSIQRRGDPQLIFSATIEVETKK